jgi:cysteine desulfurase
MTVSGPIDPPVVYLDHAATTPLRPEVREAMAPYLADCFGNPSGAHRLARQARQAVDEAREVVGGFLGADPAEVIFTAGGTEADNLAIGGFLAARAKDRGGAVVCSAIEHAAVLETCRAVTGSRSGSPPLTLRLAPVDANGVLEVGALAELVDPDVVLVSVMTANNELGTIQPLDQVAAVVRNRAPRARLHTDAVQAAPYLDLDRAVGAFDLVAVSAHKLGGPKGVGALVARRGTPLAPLLHGGGQERNLRSGTHDVAGIVGLAAACTLVAAGRATERVRVAALRDRLAQGLLGLPDTVLSAGGAKTLPGHCHVRFARVPQEELVLLLDEAGVCVSAGAACASGALEESHVLAAMGVDRVDAQGSIRFSLGYTTTADDVDRVLGAVAPAVERLRGALARR